MAVLTQFALRLSFGLSLSMAATASQRIPSGFFRNHAYVLLGLNVLAAMAAFSSADTLSPWPPVVGAVLSFVCSAVWLYDKRRAGAILLSAIAMASFVGARMAQPVDPAQSAIATTLWRLDPLTGGLLLGSTIGAMFLGHYYLNSPSMQLAPLRGLILLITGAILARAVVCGLGVAFQLTDNGLTTSQLLFLSLRWLAGILGLAVLAAMAWQTLKIPNTQSATGILYVAVILSFVGELTSQLLSVGATYPL